MIGASINSIDKAEKREKFKIAMEKIGLRVPKSIIVTNLDQGLKDISKIGFPAILRPSFTLGGTGVVFHIQKMILNLYSKLL